MVIHVLWIPSRETVFYIILQGTHFDTNFSSRLMYWMQGRSVRFYKGDDEIPPPHEERFWPPLYSINLKIWHSFNTKGKEYRYVPRPVSTVNPWFDDKIFKFMYVYIQTSISCKCLSLKLQWIETYCRLIRSTPLF